MLLFCFFYGSLVIGSLEQVGRENSTNAGFQCIRVYSSAKNDQGFVSSMADSPVYSSHDTFGL